MKNIVIVVLVLVTLVGLGVVLHAKTRSNSPTPLSDSSFATPLSQPSAETHQPTISLVFVGDVMLDRNIRLKAEQQGYPSLVGPKLSALLASAEYGVANLEGPVTTNHSLSVGSEVGSSRNFIFTFAPESLATLTEHNLTIVNLGNNHILNFGDDGLTETYQHLAQADVQHFGYASPSQPSNTTTLTLETPQGRLGFINYNQFATGGEAQAFADITAIQDQVDYLVMYTHWGNEYVPENQVLRDLAHRFVDAGVDLVIGSHPHVVTGHEVYNGKHIYYSLGNFIFDQYFSQEVKTGLVVHAVINPLTKETVVTEHQVTLANTGQTELSE